MHFDLGMVAAINHKVDLPLDYGRLAFCVEHLPWLHYLLSAAREILPLICRQ